MDEIRNLADQADHDFPRDDLGRDTIEGLTRIL